VSTLPDKSFEVATAYGEITVLGTRFFVVENTDDKSLQVELKEGKLSITAGENEKKLLTDSGMATIENKRIRLISGKEITDYTWAGAPMVFEDVTVQEIIEQINLLYGYQLIQLKAGQGIDCRMHTVVYPGMVEDFIKELQILFDIKLRRYNGTFEIDEVNCNG
jgi:ferric-dicitrate binding protein FerR (iron transport regulator)